MLKAIAIDDEPIALEVVKALAGKIPFLELQAVFASPFEALGYLQREQVDLLFLDIKMPDISGIEFLRALPDPPMVIFTTAYSEHAVQSFELDAIDYLLKPFSQARFLKACNKALQQYEYRKKENGQASAPATEGAPPTTIFVKSGYEQVRINLNELLYVESNGNYVEFVLAQSKILSRLTMAEAEALLPAPLFIRIHRSFIVGKSHISKVDRNNVWVGKTSLPVGPAYVSEVEKLTR
ncbi:LytTR family DNA-binding domain-containing protein [Paraflavitalea sp. CAU 1676]|uniref:LytR/AlgR family response regulator transcription factor n=1 Tax=Paraflavitalea sp. CAU 1676 TaxID=3032598 RepID=UPI0023DAFE61|nr:LytTR family DNA-binding domain-containing protein [Paraflavitalea sp. CAU 1676]MDF2190453.1 LytTR family DNA-binding domain-containing protein [Paraflavitalea sp. CAU 1676]